METALCKDYTPPNATLKLYMLHLPPFSTHNTDINNIIQPTSLKFQPDELIYTDGSRKEVPNMGLVTGSGIYRNLHSAPLNLRVKPYGTGMLNTINRAELITILVALRECRPNSNECIATDSRCSMQKIAKHLRLPSATVDDCHRPLIEEIVRLIVQRARAGVQTTIVKVKSHIGINGNEMADTLANEAAEAISTACDYDLSREFTEPFQDKFWPKQVTQEPTTTGNVTQTRYVKDLDNSLNEAVHDKHKLGMSNQTSIYYRAWAGLQPYRVKKCSDAFWNMSTVTSSMKRNVLNYRYGQLYNKKLAFMRKQAYLAGDGIARDRACPLCRHEDSGGHILGACLHKDMKEQYIARHDKAMRAVIQAFTKGRHGGFYLIADVGHLEGLKEIGVHSK